MTPTHGAKLAEKRLQVLLPRVPAQVAYVPAAGTGAQTISCEQARCCRPKIMHAGAPSRAGCSDLNNSGQRRTACAARPGCCCSRLGAGTSRCLKRLRRAKPDHAALVHAPNSSGCQPAHIFMLMVLDGAAAVARPRETRAKGERDRNQPEALQALETLNSMS